MASPRLCSIEGCGKPHDACGYCNSHYSRWRRHGDPLAGRTPWGAADEYLKNVVLPYRGDDCLLWPFGRSAGYGVIHTARGARLVHRIVCEEIHGPPPTPDYDAAHSCGRGADGCCAGEHLRWLTHAENQAEMIVHGTSNRGSHNGSAKLTESDVREIRRLIGSMSLCEIAELFGVRHQAISKIKRRERWAWLV